ncbi:lactonase family protein [Paenibacillus oryzisoli]|uniref:lactonase family protein n=1 Tax=Paenibacillus oryzisoli TaxID=1850517 RepID=UPI003D2DA59E
MGLLNEAYFYVGAYTSDSEPTGISYCRLNTETGEIAIVDTYRDLPNASFLALNEARTVLYAVSETDTYEGRYGGSVAAYAIAPETGKLTKLNQQPTNGSSPCYVSLDREGRRLYVANYMGGNVTVLPIQVDGSLGAPVQLLQHAGAVGPRADRQEAPHAHSIVPTPDNRFAIAADLGLDRLLVYAIAAESGDLAPHSEAALAAGAGPRHLVFSADLRYAYAVNELDSTVTVLSYDAATGCMAVVQSLPTLPAGFSGESTCADIHLSEDGRFLYASNRGDDSIAVYAVDRQHGTLTVAGWASTQGRTPRNFALSPDGGFLLAANQDSSSLVVLRRSAETGLLEETGFTAAISRPVCVKFV